jgi:hypothetical protein
MKVVRVARSCSPTRRSRCLTIRGLFELPLRKTTGMVVSFLKGAKLNNSVPYHPVFVKGVVR